MFGWFLLFVILFIFTLPTFLDGLFLYYYSTLSRDLKRTSTGLLLMFVSSLTMVASAIYLYANCLSNAALLKDSVAILFLNDIDEHVFEIVRRLKPSWVEKLEEDIKHYESMPSFIDRIARSFNPGLNLENSSCVENNEDEEDRDLVQNESVVDINPINSTVVESNASQDISLLFSHIDNLNEQIRELHGIIEDLRRSKDTENTEIRNEFRTDIKFIKNNICV